MLCYPHARCKLVATAAFVTILLCGVMPVLAKSPVKMIKLNGAVDLSAEGPLPYTLEGIASHLGEFQAAGEVEFLPGEEEGSMVGEGPVVFEAANGDLLVGIASWEIDPAVNDVANASIHFAWRDEVEFSDGTVVSDTGHFVDNRPPGLVVVVSSRTLVDLLILIITGH